MREQVRKAILISAAVLLTILAMVGAFSCANCEEEEAEDSSLPATRGATFIIAASDSSEASRAQADYICDGVNDEVEIQSAIDALPVVGGSIELLEGNYYIDYTIQIRDRLHMRGAGAESTVLNCGPTLAAPMFEYSGDTSALFTDFRDMYLYVEPGLSATHGVKFSNSTGDKYLENVFFQGFSDYNVYDDHGWHSRYISCIFEGHYGVPDNRGTGLYISGDDYKIIGCKFLYNDDGCYVRGQGQITGNYFYRNIQHGLKIAGNANVVANAFYHSSDGDNDSFSDIYMESSGRTNMNYSKIIANNFMGTDQKYAIEFTGGTYVVRVAENTFEGTYNTDIVNYASHGSNIDLGWNYGLATSSQTIEHHTSDDTLTINDKCIHTNRYAAQTITLTLPSAPVEGTAFEFAVVAGGQELRIDPGPGSAIYVDRAKQGDDLYISANVPSASVKLVADDNADWVALYTTGRWTVET